MTKVNREFLEDLRAAFELYCEAVDKTNLSRNTKRAYLSDVRRFVRWLEDDFEPGKHASVRES